MADGTTGWVLSQGPPPVGGALGWATGAGVGELHVLTTEGGGAAARQLAAFAIDTDVWRVNGTALQPVPPEALVPPAQPDADLLALATDLEAAGAEVIVEEGVVRGEVLGLEVARVGRDDDGRPTIEIGVGRHDRYAHALLGTTDLAGVVAQVRGQRRAGVPPSPANQLAPERWLRAVAVADPSLVGARHLERLPSPVTRPDLLRRAPAPAAGLDRDGASIVVVFSVGVDPELVPAASDARRAVAGDHRLVLAVPEGDDLPVTRRLAALLRDPADVVTVSREWRPRSPK